GYFSSAEVSKRRNGTQQRSTVQPSLIRVSIQYHSVSMIPLVYMCRMLTIAYLEYGMIIQTCCHVSCNFLGLHFDTFTVRSFSLFFHFFFHLFAGNSSPTYIKKSKTCSILCKV